MEKSPRYIFKRNKAVQFIGTPFKKGGGEKIYMFLLVFSCRWTRN